MKIIRKMIFFGWTFLFLILGICILGKNLGNLKAQTMADVYLVSADPLRDSSGDLSLGSASDSSGDMTK